jgi:hypothetical protein
MQADIFLLADHAQVSEGKLYVSGGGWNRLTVARVPIRQRIGLAVGLRLEPQEAGRQHSFRIEMRTPGDVVSLGHGAFESEAFAQGAFQSDAFQGSSSSQMFLLALNADLSIEAAGSYEIILSANGTDIKRIGFEVVLGS